MSDTSADAPQPLVDTAAFPATADEAGALTKSLHRLGEDEAQVFPGGCVAATKWCAGHRAAVLIVDIDGEAAPLQALDDLSAHCEPSCKIIVLGSQSDIDLYRTLLRHGVLDYLQKPVPLDLLSSTLDRARNGETDDFARVGRSIAITASGGGLGTSMATAGLAQVLSTVRHVPVAVVDYDRHKSAQSLLLGADDGAGLSTALSSPTIDAHLLHRAMATVNPRLHLLAQSPTAEPEAVDSDHVLSMGATLCRLFNQVIWDLPAGHPPGALEVLRHSEVRVVLTDFSVQGARNTQLLLHEIGDESDGQQLVLVHNRVRGEGATVPKAQFEDYVGRTVDLELPYVGPVLDESLLHGPLDLSKSQPFRQGLLDLADLAWGRRPSHRTGGGIVDRLRKVIVRRAA